jgi:hypothetical protein
MRWERTRVVKEDKDDHDHWIDLIREIQVDLELANRLSVAKT